MTELSERRKSKRILSQAIDWGLIDVSLYDRVRFAVTGKLSITHPQFEIFVDAIGGYYSDNVTYSTQVLVVPDDLTATTNKRMDAAAKGVKVVTESEFCRRLLDM